MFHSATTTASDISGNLFAVGPTSSAATSSPETGEQLGKVLHVINGEHFSGAERVQQLLGKRLAEFGYATEFACVKPNKFAQHCGLPSKRVSEFPMRGRIDLRVVSQLARKVREEKFDLLHAHTPRTALVTSMVAVKTGTPWVYHVHSPTARDSTRGMVNRFNDLIERYSIRSCDMLLTVSKSLRREMLRRGVPRQRLRVAANGVPAVQPIDAAKRLGQREWKIGMLALMRPRKGVEIALETMAELKRLGAPVTLELIGGFETEAYRSQTMALHDSLNVGDCVQWTGFTSDVPSAIRGLDALLLPSLFGEGMPMVVLEALAAAVPVIATRVEGTPEVIRDGVEGVLAEPRDASSLTAAILKMTRDRHAWLAMSLRALSRHRLAFTDAHMARSVANAYAATLECGD
ncbi:MAG: glycosyltransferase [Pirellulaceae bacterium]